MISPKQRSYLKELAHNMEPLLRIGKDGVTKNTIAELNDLLNSRELVKIKILDNNLDSRQEMIEEITEKLQCEFVQFIGSKLTIYRQSEEKKIELP